MKTKTIKVLDAIDTGLGKAAKFCSGIVVGETVALACTTFGLMLFKDPRVRLVNGIIAGIGGAGICVAVEKFVDRNWKLDPNDVVK